MSANSSLACAAENGHLHVADEAGVREALKAARDDLIEGNVALVKAIAGNFFWQGPDPAPSFDELFSYGLEGLWRASLCVHRMKHDNVGRYLAPWIRGMMLRRALQNHPLHKLHRKRKGQEKKRYLVPYEPKDGPAPDKQAVVDRWDSILAACDDDVDRQIVELRRQNESYGSIAETLNVKSKSTISDRLRKIEKRMNGANDAHKERHCLCVVKTNANPGDSPMGITQFVESVTERAPGVATPLSKLRKQFERQYGPVNRSIFTNELGRAGFRLAVTHPSIVLVLDRRLRP